MSSIQVNAVCGYMLVDHPRLNFSAGYLKLVQVWGVYVT